MARINKTQYALLGLLRVLGPATGYELKAFIDKSLGYFWQENYGHIYPVLKKLEKRGLITCSVIATDGKPSRKVYTIVEPGSKELEQWLESPLEPTLIKNELLLKIFITEPDQEEQLLSMIAREEENKKQLLKEYKRVEAQLQEHYSEEKRSLLAVKYGQHFARGIISWCREARQILAEEKK